MRVVLPPSETKAVGGVGAPLDVESLAFPELSSQRLELVTELASLSANVAQAVKALKLGARGEALLQANRELTSSPTTPAITRYTGVVYDALDYESLEPPDRDRAGETLWVFSALYGPLRATDHIPNYRLSADSSLPGGKLSARWAQWAETIWPGDFTIDLRSEAYRALCPLPAGSGVFVRFVTDTGTGKSAVGHANKSTKGALVRELVCSGAELTSRDDVIAWGAANGYDCEAVPDSESDVWLVVR
jgi:uncharacterized protein